MSQSKSKRYRDRIYIIKDIIIKLMERGQLNQTELITFCGLNLKKHKYILDELEFNELIEKNEVSVGKKNIILYKSTPKGLEFCKKILEPYEEFFPRKQ